MARVAVLNDYVEYATMAAAPLKQAGHDVLVETSPINFERVVQFAPQVISVGLYRKDHAFDRPIEDWKEDVLGYAPLSQIEDYPAIQVIPILLVGSALHERDVPTSVHYDVFLSFPGDIHLYQPKVEELAQRIKTRRTISRYICPNCQSRLTTSKRSSIDYFCPRCGTSVSIDGASCLYLKEGEGPQLPCTAEQITPPPQEDRG